MNRVYKLIIANLIIMLGFANSLNAQYCGAATYSGSISPTSAIQYTSAFGSGFISLSFVANAGCTYTFSTCGLSSADTYLRVYSTATGGTELAGADDQCGLQSTLNWTCTTSGTYSLLLCNWPCNSLASSTQISYYSSCAVENMVPDTGSNSYTLCSGNLYDIGGSSGNYINYCNGYTVLNPSTAGNGIQVSGTISGEACCDYMYIYNGAGTGGTLLWSGNAGVGTVPVVTSTSGPLTVQFVSDVSIVGTGFNLTVSCVPLAPAAPTSITASPSAICNGSSTTLTAVGAIGTVYWFTGGCNTTGQIGTGNSITVSPTTTTTYYARNNSGGNWSLSCASTTVVVNPIPTVNAGPDVSICAPNSTTLNGTISSGSTSLSSVLAAINTNQATLTASIPTPYGYVMDGTGGVNANYIGDGGSDMYDWGNFINTNLGASINYSDNTVVSNAAFGTGGQYFTRVIGAQGYSTTAPTIFYWAADLNGVSSVSITGNNGADGSGVQDLNTFTVTANGITYNCFLKRVHSAFDPSINQLFMIPQPNTASQSMGASTDDNLHTISGLTGVTRMYYMLYAGNGGAIISIPQATNIAQTFANIIPTGGTYAWTSTPAGFTSSVQNPTVTPTATTTYTLTTTSNGCSNSDNVIVTVNTPPAATLSTTSSTVCNGTQVNLGGNVTASGAWTLNLSNGQTVSGTGNAAWNATVTPSASTTYTISSITNSTGCPSSLSGSTTVTLPTAGSALGNNNESATCLVNQNGWIHFYHSSGRLLASINSLGQNLGNVTVTSYVDVTNASVPACTNPNPIYNTSVMQRHWVITPTIQPTTPVQVRLPYSNAEFSNLTGVSTLNANPNDDVFVPTDVKLSKYSGPLNVNANALDNCTGAGGSGGTTQHNPVTNGLASAYSAVGGAYYSDFSIPGFSEFWLNGNLSASPLPVELTSFQANCTSDSKVELTWTTASEHNSSHYVVEKTTNGQEWVQLATVQAAGNSTSTLNYSIIDPERNSQTAYYRLTQIDVDGASKTYDPVSINCEELISMNEVVTYPNPSNSDFYVQVKSANYEGEGTIKIIDVQGSIVRTIPISIEKGITIHPLENTNFAPGIYYIQVENEVEQYQIVRHVVK